MPDRTSPLIAFRPPEQDRYMPLTTYTRLLAKALQIPAVGSQSDGRRASITLVSTGVEEAEAVEIMERLEAVNFPYSLRENL